MENKIFRFLQRLFSWRNIGGFLSSFGLLLALFFIIISLISIGDDTGINRSQIKGILVSLCFIILGLWMWRPDKTVQKSKSPLIRFIFSTKGLGVILLSTGVVLIFATTAADIFGKNLQSGFGFIQTAALILGIFLTLAGAWLWFLHKYIKMEKLNPVLHYSRIQRMYISLLILGLGLTAIYLVNNIYSRINMQAKSFDCINYFTEAENHVGADFRTGIFRPPTAELHHENIYLTGLSNYPPFTILFFTPLQIFNEDTAYLIIVGLLTLANVVSIWLSTILVRDLLFNRLKMGFSNTIIISMALFMAVLFYTISGYPFMFSIERGNYDSIATFLAILAIYLAIKKPDSLWWQVILLSAATHLKMYPAALFLVLFYKHGKKMILPTILINSIMLFSLGHRNAIWFIEIMIKYTLAAQVWVGNHSGYSFAGYMLEKIPDLAIYSSELTRLMSILPIVIWVFSSYYSVKNLKTDICILMLMMTSIPLMCMLPTVSHDYKLVVLIPAILIFIALLIHKIVRSSNLWDYLQLVFVLVISLLISRSYMIIAEPYWFISNKYPLLLLLSIMMLLNIFSLKFDPELAITQIDNRVIKAETIENQASA